MADSRTTRPKTHVFSNFQHGTRDAATLEEIRMTRVAIGLLATAFLTLQVLGVLPTRVCRMAAAGTTAAHHCSKCPATIPISGVKSGGCCTLEQSPIEPRIGTRLVSLASYDAFVALPRVELATVTSAASEVRALRSTILRHHGDPPIFLRDRVFLI